MSNTNAPKIRTIFMGTPEFALPGLKSLLAAPQFEILSVVTQTDKPIGRQKQLTPPPVKKVALSHGLRVLQPEKIRQIADIIGRQQPDLIVVIAYGQIIPPAILEIPRWGCINVHASLLPKYRGAACLSAPILNGDSETGITIMKMDSGLDTGPILRQNKLGLSGRESLKNLHDRLSQLGADLLAPTLLDFTAGKIIPQIQDDSLSSYVGMIKKEDGRINWQEPAQIIERRVRAYNPWPGTYTTLEEDKAIKILEAGPIIKDEQRCIGELFLQDKRLLVRCGQDSLVILKLQLSGKKPLSGSEFIRGHANFIGQILK